jgi:uncharacterized protein YidB (DUF937 family)
MNMFDGILGNVVGSVLGGGTSQGSRNPLGAILQDLGGAGGNNLANLGNLGSRGGLAALPSVAAQLGISGGQAGSAMARILPELINQLTPHGQIPIDHADLVSQGLTALKSGQP